MTTQHLWKALGLLMCLGFISACGDKSIPAGDGVAGASASRIVSPSGNIAVNFFLTDKKEPAYQVFFREKMVIDTSLLGFELQNQPDLQANFRIRNLSVDSLKETWQMPWGVHSYPSRRESTRIRGRR